MLGGALLCALPVVTAATAVADAGDPTPLDPAAAAAAPDVTSSPDPGAPAEPAPLDPAAPQVQGLGPLGAAGLSMDQFLLGQRIPSGDPGASAPNTDLLSAGQFLNPTQYRVPGDGAANQYQLQPGAPGPFARVDGLKGTHAMLHGALGRMPAPQLSEPLPGTAPPAGTNIPVGPVGNLDDPGAASVPLYGTAPVEGGPRLPEPAPPVDAPAP